LLDYNTTVSLKSSMQNFYPKTLTEREKERTGTSLSNHVKSQEDIEIQPVHQDELEESKNKP